MWYRILSKRSLKLALANCAPQSLYLSINAFVAARDIKTGRRWDPPIGLLPRFIREGDTVLDVGGNHGLYTYHLSRLVGSSGCVHTFEPLPPNIRILRHTIKTHCLANVTLHPNGCGDKNDKAVFCVPLDHGIPQLGWGKQGVSGLKFECQIKKIDDCVKSRASFLKIDIEGAELFALRGAEQLLRESRPIILVEAENHTVNFGYAQQEVFDFLSALDYAFFDSLLSPVNSFVNPGNYFCFPR